MTNYSNLHRKGSFNIAYFFYIIMKKESNRDHGNLKKSGENTDGDNLNGNKENSDDGKYYTGSGKHYRGK